MPYKQKKQKFCHDCGAAIERANQTIFTNRYYCELCETEHTFDFWSKRAFFTLCVLFGVVGLGMFLQKPEKPLNLVSRNFTGNQTITNSNVAREQAANNVSNQNSSKTQNINSIPATPVEKLSIVRAGQNLPAKNIENQTNAVEETVYFCGAPTKKGTPCSRRVKGGGRCWQHVGKQAMLPKDKLIASQ